MELQLGLGFSNFSHKVPILKELDLISYVNGEAKEVYDDGSTLSSQNSVNFDEEGGENDGGFCVKKKRRFGDAFEAESSVSHVCKTLPLLLWDEKPNEEEKDPKRVCESSSFSIAKSYEDAIVGWPPIKSYRKKLHQQKDAHLHCHRHCRRRGNFPVAENGGGCGGSQSTYVKVQMEGCGITRKIDLRLYHSYESLMYGLLTMFGKGGKDSVDGYKLTYQDKEGDWLLGGDLPRRTFIRSVQRFKLMKKED